jgi:hypothetical protein
MPEMSQDFQVYVGLATAAALLVIAVLAIYLAVRKWREK